MTPISLRALIALKLLVLVALWSFGSARTAVSSPPGALARVQSHNGDGGDLFGSAVALSRDGQVLVVGADLEASRSSADGADNALPGAGAAYVFQRDGDGWRQIAYLKAPTPTSGGGFGFAVAVSDDGQTIAVSAPFEPGAGLGSVHVFRGSGSQWTPVAHLQAPEGVERFGVDMDLSNSGAELAVAAVGPAAQAQAHVFTWRARRWVLDGVPGDRSALAGLQRPAETSADNSDSRAGSGSVHRYQYVASAWKLKARLKAPTPTIDARLGLSLAVDRDGDFIAVGSEARDDLGGVIFIY